MRINRFVLGAVEVGLPFGGYLPTSFLRPEPVLRRSEPLRLGYHATIPPVALLRPGLIFSETRW